MFHSAPTEGWRHLPLSTALYFTAFLAFLLCSACQSDLVVGTNEAQLNQQEQDELISALLSNSYRDLTLTMTPTSPVVGETVTITVSATNNNDPVDFANKRLILFLSTSNPSCEPFTAPCFPDQFTQRLVLLLDGNASATYIFENSGSVTVAAAIVAPRYATQTVVTVTSNQPGEVLNLSQASQHGITWFFDSYDVGQFVNGDYYMVAKNGTCVVDSVTPAPTSNPYRNNSMVDPRTESTQGYDDRPSTGPYSFFNANKVAQFPVELQPIQSLVSSISRPDDAETVVDLIGRPITVDLEEGAGSGWLKTAAVLTCLAAPVSATSFRPTYMGGVGKQIFDAATIRRDLLPELESPGGTMHVTNGAGTGTPAEQYARYFERPWIMHLVDYTNRDIHPYENMPNYHQYVYSVIADAINLLLVEDDTKEQLLIHFLQVAIDMYYASKSATQNPDVENADSSVHKIMPLVFGLLVPAGSEMLDGEVTDRFEQYRTNWMAYYGHQNESSCTSNVVPYDEGWTGDTALFRRDRGAEYEHMDPGYHGSVNEWYGSCFPSSNSGGKREVYRRSNSHNWPPAALAARILNLVGVWNHPAFFDYADRWMTPEDPSMRNHLNDEDDDRNDGDIIPIYHEHGETGSSFATNMWNTYRNQF